VQYTFFSELRTYPIFDALALKTSKRLHKKEQYADHEKNKKNVYLSSLMMKVPVHVYALG
jgi:hypothetical protein